MMIKICLAILSFTTYNLFSNHPMFFGQFGGLPELKTSSPEVLLQSYQIEQHLLNLRFLTTSAVMKLKTPEIGETAKKELAEEIALIDETKNLVGEDDEFFSAINEISPSLAMNLLSGWPNGEITVKDGMDLFDVVALAVLKQSKDSVKVTEKTKKHIAATNEWLVLNATRLLRIPDQRGALILNIRRILAQSDFMQTYGNLDWQGEIVLKTAVFQVMFKKWSISDQNKIKAFLAEIKTELDDEDLLLLEGFFTGFQKALKSNSPNQALAAASVSTLGSKFHSELMQGGCPKVS